MHYLDKKYIFNLKKKIYKAKYNQVLRESEKIGMM